MAGSKVSDELEAAKRYAGALLTLAQEKGQLTAIHTEFRDFVALAKGSKDLTRLLISPAYSRDDKANAIGEIAKKSGVSPLFAKFLGTMAKNGRARDIVATGAAFETLYAKQRGVTRVIVRTAEAMSAEQTKRIEGIIRAAAGGDVELTREVDPALVGGIQLRIGSRLVDASLAAKLNRMNTVMKGA